jgi:hypothetical protein
MGRGFPERRGPGAAPSLPSSQGGGTAFLSVIQGATKEIRMIDEGTAYGTALDPALRAAPAQPGNPWGTAYGTALA